MGKLNEQEDVVYGEAHAKELLNIQTDYNNKLKALNDELAKRKSDLLVKYMKLAQQKASTASASEKPKQTGTVDTAGNPVNAQGNPPPPTVESYPNIIKIKKINEDDEEIRFSEHPNHPRDFRNWYQKPEAQANYEEPKPTRRKKLTQKQKERLQDIPYEIEDLQNEIEYTMEKFRTPEFEGVEGEIEQFFAEVGFEAADILNSGISDKEKIKSLDDIGIENPEEILKTYYYYYPEFDKSLDKERKEAEKHVKKLEDQIEKLEKELEKLEVLDESLNESIYQIDDFDPDEFQSLKDYLDAESISYIENEDDNTIEFDEDELDYEWRDRLETLGYKDLEDEDTSDILSIEDEDDLSDQSEEIDEKKVFYVKVEDEGEVFIGKIYKLFDDGDWRSKIVDGESETFEKLNYDPEWDEIDIIAFLRENYADADIISKDEFDEHVEEPEIEPEKEFDTNESLNEESQEKDDWKWYNDVFNYLTTDFEMEEDEAETFMNIVEVELEELCENGESAFDAASIVFANEDALEELESLRSENEEFDEEIEESKKEVSHSIPTLDEYMNKKE